MLCQVLGMPNTWHVKGPILCGSPTRNHRFGIHPQIHYFPADPAYRVSGGAVQDLTSSRAGGQDDGSLANSLKQRPSRAYRVYRAQGGTPTPQTPKPLFQSIFQGFEAQELFHSLRSHILLLVGGLDAIFSKIWYRSQSWL